MQIHSAAYSPVKRVVEFDLAKKLCHGTNMVHESNIALFDVGKTPQEWRHIHYKKSDMTLHVATKSSLSIYDGKSLVKPNASAISTKAKAFKWCPMRTWDRIESSIGSEKSYRILRVSEGVPLPGDLSPTRSEKSDSVNSSIASLTLSELKRKYAGSVTSDDSDYGYYC